MKKKLNIGLVGYGFMGRTHSNAFLQAPRFFDVPYEPVLRAVCARNADRVKAFECVRPMKPYPTSPMFSVFFMPVPVV